MTYALNEPFDDSQGRWDEFAPWDGTMSSDSVKGFLTTQKHVDLRCFRVIQNTDPAPQDPNLDTVQQTVLDAETQTKMETQPAANDVNENWILSGVGGLGAITVGAIAARGGWPGLQATTTAGAIDATITSSLSTGIDISPGTNLDIIFPDYNAWDTNSYVQMTSDPAGAFGTGHDSTQVTFASNSSAMPELKLAVSAFANSGFDNTNVTGILIRLRKATGPGSGHTVTVMAIRSIPAAWGISWLDFDTRIGSVVRPVTLDGNTTTGTVAQDFKFVRGDGSKSDPIPADLAMNMYFYGGGQTSPNDATGSTYNTIGFIMREVKDIANGTGSHIASDLSFNDTTTTFTTKFVSTTGGSPGTTVNSGVYTATLPLVIDPSLHYLWRVQIKGTQVIPELWQVNTDHSLVELVWQSPSVITNSAYIYRNGRVGFRGNLISRDAYIEAIEVAPTGFAELETVTYNSYTPVDGAQLSAVYATDENLFTGMSAPLSSGLILDSTKTISGDGSYRSTGSMSTNTFLVDDWTQMYLSLSIWVSNSVSMLNQPEIVLYGGGAPETIPMTALKPSQWNTLYFDLGVFRNLVSATSYYFTITPGANPDKPLGFFWVDSTDIGRRRVSWSARATSTGLWREFKEMVNNPTGAVHFIPEERGTMLQLKADALTEDAWVSSFNLFPRYAQLGLPLFDQGGINEVYDAEGGAIAPGDPTVRQGATARVKVVGMHAAQTATAHIASLSHPQSAKARIKVVGFTSTQSAKARIFKSGLTKTQTAIARMAKAGNTKTQGSIARIGSPAPSKTQGALARVLKAGLTKTQTAIARISKGGTKTQTAIARIAPSVTKTQGAVSRIKVVGVAKTQGATSRIMHSETHTQTAIAHIGSGPDEPEAPASYTLPGTYTLVSNSSQLITALGMSQRNIVLASGTYANSSSFENPNSSSMYSQSLGGALLTAGVDYGGNSGSGGAVFQGLAFNVTSSAATDDSSILYGWGASAENASVLDCTFNGNYDIGIGLNALNPDGLICQRCTFTQFTDVALRASDNTQVAYHATTPIINIITDISVDGVTATPPGNLGGTGETGVWVGHPVTNGVNRIKIRNTSWDGLETVNNSWDTTFQNLDIDMSAYDVEGVAIYLEHFSTNNIFTKFILTGCSVGVNAEWNDGTSGQQAANNCSITNGTINAAGWTGGGHTAGVYLDEGTGPTTITGNTFLNQNWAAVGAYLPSGTITISGNTYSLAGGVNFSSSHI